ncbi:MAG: hypothetical protein JOZ01_04880, partial [Candidatus Eremiobacteraeota bacterium]|nr:hypothetical protein [Candidatus Eremiobacteraeota bacterium]
MSKRIGGWFGWIVPGLGIKRWVVLTAVGIVLVLDAMVRWLIAEGAGIHVNEILDDIVDD